ncbi:MAG: hypothetical protein P0Y56_08550 [Candidatus Andeanibacterium colombiense]|uniref:Uncharacterized protein n=1 Tax=Candidatus Andeanibacterium colombiense TaxID=3121345 RepID=A0AAJ5X9F0_9SPHN|nr:MAG: hypothetical protein P0Y56_08550 [Sphingomonadaceae bacterium]
MTPRHWRALYWLTSAAFIVAGIWYLTAWYGGGDMSVFENRYTLPWMIPVLILNRIAAYRSKPADNA